VKVNVDLLVARCNTFCQHCYVNGGPQEEMPIASVRALFLRLATFLKTQASLGLVPSVTLDNEVFNHPQVTEVYELTARHLQPYYYHHGSTTGLALLQLPDAQALLKNLRAHGWGTFSLSLHGGPVGHDTLVRRPGAFVALSRAAQVIKDAGCELVLSLIVGKPLIEERELVSQFLEQTPHDSVYAALVNHAPIQRLMDYLPYRAAMPDLALLAPYLPGWGIDEHAFFSSAAQGSERACVGLIREWGIWDNIPRSQGTLYLSVDQNLNLFEGNTGLHTAYLGNFATDEPEALAAKTAALPSNEFFWDSCFNLENLPGYGGFDKDSRKAVNENLVFSDWDSCLSYWMMRAGIPARLI
jgi:hypothetical protein